MRLNLVEKYKKIFAGLGIMLILAPSIFFAIPEKAEAVVLTWDAITSAELGSLTTKEFGLDAVAYAASQVVIQNMSDSVIQWIRGGFKGGPGFITNYEKFFSDAADQVTGRWMKDFLKPEIYREICGPWAPRVFLALNLRATKAKRYRCTLNSVVSNIDEFMDDFDKGGWKAWLAMTGNSSNDPVGLYLTTSSDLINELIGAEKNARTESQANAGFLSVKRCAEESYDEWTGETFCSREEAVSPGKWVESELSAATGIEFQRMALADELNEIIMAAVGQFIKMGLTELRK